MQAFSPKIAFIDMQSDNCHTLRINISVRNIPSTMSNTKLLKATSYRDLLKTFQQAEITQTPREKKPVSRALYLKKSTIQENKQNIPNKQHTHSVHQKSQAHHNSEWIEEEVLREYNHKRKDRQLQLSYNKFIAYITGLLSKLASAVPPELLVMKMSYLQLLAALKEMVFIKETYQPSPHDSVTQLWNDLVSHGQTFGAFIVIVAGILKMRKSEEQNNKEQYFWKKYAELRYTRMQQLGRVKTNADAGEQYSYSPMISQRSRTLAASRSKSKGNHERCIAQRSYNQLLEESNDQQTSNSISKQTPNSKAGNRRSQILYKMARQKSHQKKRDKKSSEVEYEKSINELTFHPKIHHNNIVEKPKRTNIHGQQDTINRMIRGRVEREVKKIIQSKGLPYNEKMFQKMKRQRYEAIQSSKTHIPQEHPVEYQSGQLQQRVPIKHTESIQNNEVRIKTKQPLVLTIEIDEGHCEKLIIRQGECYKETASKFIKQYNLSPQMYDKLVEGVENALKFQLTQIDEDSLESEYESTH